MIPIAPHIRRLGAALVACCAAPFASANEDITVTLLDEAFESDQRLVENLPATAAWYGSGATTLNQTAAGSIVASAVSGSGTQVLFHFTQAGAPYALAVNETLKVSFDLNLTKVLSTGTGLRMGVLDSQGSRVTTDGAGTSNVTFSTDRGYSLFLNPIGTGNNLNLRVRTSDSGSLLISAATWTSLVNGAGAISMADDQTYSVLFQITRTANGATVAAQISGGNLAQPISVSHSTSTDGQIFTSFDKFAICLLGTATSGTVEDPGLMTISNAKVVATMPAPPPPPPPPAENTLFLDEAFLDAERTVENLPATAAWYGSNSTLEQVAAGSIRVRLASASNQHVFTHFRPNDQPYTLTVGEKLTVKFDFNLTKALDTGTGIRLGLLNSNGTRVTTDTSAVSNSNFANDRGYGIYMNPLNTTGVGGFELRGRTAANNQLLTAAGAWPQVYAATDSPLVMAVGQTYSMELSVRRIETGVTLKVTLSGGDLADPVSLAYDQISPDAFVSFDKFAIGVLATAHTGTVEDPAYLTLSNVSIAATTLPDTVGSTELFAAWAANEAVTFAGDANNDGVADGLAWLLGVPDASTNAAGLLPFAGANNGGLDVAFTLLAEASRGVAELRLQHSPDLAEWTTVSIPDTSGVSGGIDFTVTPDGDVNEVQATIPSSIVGDGGRFFIRLVGELEPTP